ncbi:alkyl sulfatase BDS1-like metallo-beta-lactamase superfamily hydrolase [Catenulispora sp. EB89]|uniref:hypothetical protein n=1 Tax=Catenulispora sp. EB89 TaxID=3156257 RepID=UPI0035137FBD
MGSTPDTANPSLWRQARLVTERGLSADGEPGDVPILAPAGLAAPGSGFDIVTP